MMTPREKMQSLGRAHASAGVALNESIARTEASRLRIGTGEALQVYRQAYHSEAQRKDREFANRNARAEAFMRSQSHCSRSGRNGSRGTFVNRPLGQTAY
jgi:hypothetical protein